MELVCQDDCVISGQLVVIRGSTTSPKVINRTSLMAISALLYEGTIKELYLMARSSQGN